MKKKEAERLAAWVNIAPKVLRIGAYDHQLVFIDGWVKNEKTGENCWGQYNPSRRLLTVAIPETTSQPLEIASTTLHEILHAIWSERGLSERKVKEEEAVGHIEAGLMGFFRQNPSFLKWFMEIF